MTADDDPELERLWADFQRQCTDATNERARSILDSLDRATPMDVPDGAIVLLGFEGQVDGIVRWGPSPLPDVFRRPLRQRLSVLEPTVYDVLMPEAQYRRVGEFSYKRER